MGRAAYGYFGVVLSTATLFGTTVGTALSLTLIKYLAHAREMHSADASATLRLTRRLAMLLAAVLSMGTVALSSVIANNILNAPGLEQAVAASAILVGGQIYTEWQLGALLGMQAFAVFGVASACRPVLLLIGTGLGAYWRGITGAVWGAGAGLAVAGVVLEYMMRNTVRICSAPNSAASPAVSSRQLLAYFTPTFLGAIAFQPFIWWAHTLIVRTNNGATQMAIVSVAMQWRALMTFLPINLQKAALPILTAGYARSGDGGRVGLMFSHYITEILVWVSVTGILVGTPVILHLYGSGFASEQLAFTLIVGGLAVGFLGYTYGTVILSKGWVWVGALGNLICGLITGVMMYASHDRNAVTFGFATLVAYFVLNSLTISVLIYRSAISTSMGVGSIASSIAMIAITVVAGHQIPFYVAWIALLCGGLCIARSAKLLQLARAQPSPS
jgi:O-antigen/teichoic acid export membrane protein